MMEEIAFSFLNKYILGLPKECYEYKTRLFNIIFIIHRTRGRGKCSVRAVQSRSVRENHRVQRSGAEQGYLPPCIFWYSVFLPLYLLDREISP